MYTHGPNFWCTNGSITGALQVSLPSHRTRGTHVLTDTSAVRWRSVFCFCLFCRFSNVHCLFFTLLLFFFFFCVCVFSENPLPKLGRRIASLIGKPYLLLHGSRAKHHYVRRVEDSHFSGIFALTIYIHGSSRRRHSSDKS